MTSVAGISAERADRVIDALWSDPALDVYAVLDCARDRRIHPWIHRRALDFTSLYRGPVAPALDRCAPYLVHLYRRQAFTRELLTLGWGNNWGIFLATTASMETLRVHLRRFLRVRDERGRRLLFRYYDPRVLRVYLPTCRADELRFVFGPIARVQVENTSADALIRFHDDHGTLITESVRIVESGAPG